MVERRAFASLNQQEIEGGVRQARLSIVFLGHIGISWDCAAIVARSVQSWKSPVDCCFSCVKSFGGNEGESSLT